MAPAGTAFRGVSLLVSAVLLLQKQNLPFSGGGEPGREPVAGAAALQQLLEPPGTRELKLNPKAFWVLDLALAPSFQ